MKNLSIIALALIVLFFASCESDNDLFDTTTIDPTTSTETIPAGANDLHEPLENVEAFTKEMTNPEIAALNEKEIVAKFTQPIEFAATNDNSVTTRGGALACGSSIYGTTSGRSNKVSSALYRTMGLNTNLDGGDDIYHFTLATNETVSLDLINTTTNMAMVLFRGSVNCAGGSCSYRLTQLIDHTRSSSSFGDQLNHLNLTPGTYILVVDAPAGRASDFRLDMNCSRLGTPVFNILETFNHYYNGNITPQSTDWKKWNAGALYDGQVVGGGDKFLFMERKTLTHSTDQPDVLFSLDNSSHTYHVDFKIWVADHRSAYFNLQKQLSFNNNSNEFGAQVFFYNNQTGAVKIAGRTYPFTYRQGTWTKVKLDIHTDLLTNDGASISIDDSMVAQFNPRWSSNTYYGSDKLQAIDFYPYASDSKFWIDDIHFTNL